jgi:hypothetical protein
VVNILFAVGYALFGSSIMRLGVWPRGAGLMIAIGGPLFGLGWRLTVMLLGVESEAASTLGDVLLSGGLVWLGYALWTSGAAKRARVAAATVVPAAARSS